MLSYRHAFHAGNHADVLKHTLLIELLHYLTGKDKPLWYIDTHAGAGSYKLDGAPDAPGGEYHGGIGRLWSASGLPVAVSRYVDLVRRHGRGAVPTRYPGSPRIAYDLLRNDDRLWLSELHPADHAALVAEFRHDRSRVRIEKIDGFASLRALLPPQPRRALVMIDPSYEVKTDYDRVVDALVEARQRFPTGVYAIWYPLLPRRETATFGSRLIEAAGERWLDARLTVRRGSDADAGLFGSGMFVVNAPYTLPEMLKETLPFLAGLLAEDSTADHVLDYVLP